MKIKELLKEGINLLKENNIDEPDFKAKILMQYLLNFDSNQLILNYENETEKEIEFRKYIDEIIDGKPVQYITNSQYFYGLEFYVDRNVLIPQPDTEILVEEVINICKNQDKKLKILDICTGSGAIAVSICKNTNSEVVASDISSEAIKIAEKNAYNNFVNIDFIESDMFENIFGKFDIIVSNPPYIESSVIGSLSKEVQNEPKLALDGGEDGLNFYKILANESKNFLNNEGLLAVEIGYNQKDNVIKIFENEGFLNIYCKKDLSENDRIIVGKYKEEN